MIINTTNIFLSLSSRSRYESPYNIYHKWQKFASILKWPHKYDKNNHFLLHFFGFKTFFIVLIRDFDSFLVFIQVFPKLFAVVAVIFLSPDFPCLLKRARFAIYKISSLSLQCYSTTSLIYLGSIYWWIFMGYPLSSNISKPVASSTFCLIFPISTFRVKLDATVFW